MAEEEQPLEEQPLKEARKALENEPAIVTPLPESTAEESRRPLVVSLLAGGGIIVCLLLVAGLFLPPISLASRFGNGEEETAQATADTDSDTESAGGTTSLDGLTVNADGATIVVETIPHDEFMAGEMSDENMAMAEGMPDSMSVMSDVYMLEREDDAAATGTMAMVMPEMDMGIIDLYGWDGSRWLFIPVAHENGQIVSSPGPLPLAAALFEVGAAEGLSVGSDVQPEESLPAPILPYLTEVTLGRLVLQDDGSLDGELAEISTGAYQQMIQVTNVGAIIDQTALTDMLADETVMTQNIADVAAAAADYAGVNLDYQGVPAGTREAFTTYVARLADALHADGKLLVVTLGTPAHGADGSWDPAGQDWAAIGQLADMVYAQLPLNPSVYHEGGPAHQLLEWAVARVDRHKLSLQVTAYAIETVGSTFRPVASDAALASFGELNLVEGDSEIDPGTAIEVSLAGSASPLEWDGDSLMYKYTYEEDGQTRTVWIHNEAALSYQIQAANLYNVHGVMITGLAGVDEGNGYAAAIERIAGKGDGLEVSGAAISWTVLDENGGVVASESGESLTYRWESTDQPGTYTINAEFAQGDTIATLGTLEIMVREPEVAETEAEEPEEEATPTPEAEDTGAAAVVPNATPAPIDPGTADAAVGITANLRKGPSVAYGVIEVVPQGTRVSVVGRSSSSEWLTVAFDEKEGWIFASLLSLNPGLDVAALPVVQAPPPVAGGGDDGGGGSPLPPPPPPAAAGGSFELGGQTNGSPRSAVMSSAGMTWVKRQHKWGPGNTGNDVAGLVQDAHANGFKVLLSIPGQLHPSSIDYGAYVTFLGQVAALADPPDAIEVWNEMNIDREWPSGQISPQSYVENMLAPAYTAIKNANPNVMVVTGAPAPTGFYGGGCSGGGCDDAPYIAGMMAAGAGSYSDCVGVHYNEGIMPPAATSGDPRGNGGHYTRYFQGMVNAYVGAGAGTLCFTELGYLSGEEWGYVPQGFLWRAPYNLTVAEHAQYLAEAASLAANSGRVRLMIVFNVDFTSWGDDPQAGYAMIRPDGSCPACILLGQVMGTQ